MRNATTGDWDSKALGEDGRREPQGRGRQRGWRTQSPLGTESWGNAGHRGQQTKNDQQQNGQQHSLPLRRLE